MIRMKFEGVGEESNFLGFREVSLAGISELIICEQHSEFRVYK